MKHPRGSSLLRVLRLAEYLRSNRATVRTLGLRFGVTTRTIRRDLILLQQVPMPVCKTDFDPRECEPSLWWIAC